jgi:hypothetical protein
VVFLAELQLATSVTHDPSEYQAGSWRMHFRNR